MSPTADSPVIILLKPQQAANALGVSLRTIMGMVASNEIPFVRLGERNLRFHTDALREWVSKRTTWPTAISISSEAQQ